VSLPNRDYRYRLIVPKASLVTVVAALAEEQEWSNFKDEAAQFQGAAGSDYVRALHRVWGVMFGLQESAAQHAVVSEPAGLDKTAPYKSAADITHAEKKLAAAVRLAYGAHGAKIEELKAEGAEIWDSPNFIWERLLAAFSTMGNSRGVKLVRDPLLHDPVRYPALLALTPEERLLILTRSLRTAVVRMPDRKAQWLVANFERIQADGGPNAIKRKLEGLAGRAQKIAYLLSFRGIGNKYARDMMMDAYHPEFRDSVAFDVRVRKVADALGIKFANYKAAEEFFVAAAARADINCWELDRLLYYFTDDVLISLAQ
jgi:hypothetical protein